MTATAGPVRIANVMLSLIAIGAFGACGSSSSSSKAGSASASLAPGCRAASAADQTVKTARHVFLLHVGHPEAMVMPGDPKDKHLASGELMVGGSMAGMFPGASSGRSTLRHLEVHICDRPSGKVLTSAMPAITLSPAPGGTAQQVPVMVMEGIRAGAGDLHYGNNVPMRPGAAYAVSVLLGADRTVFTYTLPRGA